MTTKSSSSANSFEPEQIISHEFPEETFTYTERDVALYALGIGACTTNALDEKELKYVYHKDGEEFIKVLPTFAALFTRGAMQKLTGLPGLQFDPKLLLHGQQYIEIYKPFPSSACGLIGFYCLKRLEAFAFLILIQNRFSVAGLHDKGKATILEVESRSYEKKSGDLLCMNRMTIYLRGAGGFSKSSRPYSYTKYPANQVLPFKIPNSPPFAIHEDFTQPSQALLYRLSGDYNPLHSDPTVAEIAGFSRPILHGLCTLGFAVKAIIKCVCDGEPTMVRSIFGRFLLHVYPGETLITEMWLEGSRVLFQTKVRERNRAVLSGYVVLGQLTSQL